MRSDPGQHLNSEELDLILGANAGDLLPADKQAHAAECPACNALISQHAAQQARICGIARQTMIVTNPACPAEEELGRLAAGLLAGERAEWLLNHAAECDRCGRVLQLAVECIATEVDSDEEQIIQRLKSSATLWQREMAGTAAQAARASNPPIGRKFRFAELAWAAALLIAVAGVVWWRSRPTPSAVAVLLANAYSEQRPFEVRIEGGAPAPIRVLRGTTISSFDRPQSLLEAESRIQKQVASHPASAEWIKLRGRAEILDLKPSSAVDSLERALQLKPNDADILADLGSALILRATNDGHPEDYSRAVDALNWSLQSRPDAPSVIFNLALAYEHLKLYNQAIEAWNRYLEIDSRSGWAPEARKNLGELIKKKD